MRIQESTAKARLVVKLPRYQIINFNHSTKTREEKTVYVCEQVELGRYAKRGEIISAIICNKYPEADEFAMINNYLVNPDDVEIQAGYAEYQSRRVLAKALASCVITGFGNLSDVKQVIRDLQLDSQFDLRKSDDALKAELKAWYYPVVEGE